MLMATGKAARVVGSVGGVHSHLIVVARLVVWLFFEGEFARR